MSTQAAPSRVVLVEDPARAPSRIRRYRVARIQVNPQPGPQSVDKRYSHLKRLYD